MIRRTIIFIAAAITLFFNHASAAPSVGNDVIPLIEMENVPLTDAIRKIAGWARLNIVIDPRLSAPPFDAMKVSIRWQNVTAREALTALLDNYGLILVDTPRPSGPR